MSDKVKETIDDRVKVYGDPMISHRAIGYVWRGILQNRFHDLAIPELPPDLVAEMMAGFKAVRANRPIFHEDSYVDREAYQRFSREFRRTPSDDLLKLANTFKDELKLSPELKVEVAEMRAQEFVVQEMARAKKLHPTSVPRADDHGLVILMEEVGEAAEALLEWRRAYTDRKPDAMLRVQTELIQVAAVAVLMAASTLEGE